MSTPLTIIARRFEEWREHARRLLGAGVSPDSVRFADGFARSSDLFGADDATTTGGCAAPAKRQMGVPRRFIDGARGVACHRDGDRFNLLYRLLWRLQETPNLLADPLDDDVLRFHSMAKHVSRDIHKMHAFVRFRGVTDESGGETFVAWHRPDHHIVRETATFFRDRFRPMRWSILTPDECAHWDPSTEELAFTEGVTRDAAPTSDALEELWLTYYGAVFNPARIKLGAMTKEMPTRHWRTLPETRIIPQLLQEAPQRVRQMIEVSAMAKKVTAADYIPEGEVSLPLLAKASQACKGCDLCCAGATQAVFGEGPEDARLVFVGEQPGDQEDKQGRPFVGPAGKVLSDAMEAVGIDRTRVYVTNAVKHFKFVQRGKLRMHQTPNVTEVKSCRPWLEKELELIRPPMVVALGATAAKSLFGQAFRITQQRGEVFESEWAPWCMATLHPSALLRIPEPEAKRAAEEAFAADLATAAKQFRKVAG